jgi:hypothetical protein
VKHYSDLGFDPKFSDIADSDLASYTAHPIDTIEPLPEVQSDYRTAAKTHMATLEAIDFWMSNAANPRLAWITVALTFDLTSVRGWTEVQIANHLGVSPSTLSRATARFREMAGLDHAGGLKSIHQSNGDKPTSIQA